MPSRRRLTQEERRAVYETMGGHCAYCGCELPYKDMQVDHVVPLQHGGADDPSNMFPACRGCNHYKRGMELKWWREQIERIPDTLLRDCYTYRRGLSFGMVAPMPHKVVFYFERISREEVQQ